MYYILYQQKKGTQERGWRGFSSGGDAINFLMKNAKNYLMWKIIQVERGLSSEDVSAVESKPIEKIEGINVQCKACGKGLAPGNESGYCGRCASGSRLKTSKRICEFEGCTNKIASWNKSGLCQGCCHRSDSALQASKRKKKRYEAKETEKKKEKRIGKCKKPECGKEFELEDWQHSSLHWCKVCQLSPAYKDFKDESRQRS